MVIGLGSGNLLQKQELPFPFAAPIFSVGLGGLSSAQQMEHELLLS